MSAFQLGFPLGTEVDFRGFVVSRYFRIQAYEAIYDVMIAGYFVGRVIGPIRFGAVFDQSSNYSLALRLSAAELAATAVAVLTVDPYQYSPPVDS